MISMTVEESLRLMKSIEAVRHYEPTAWERKIIRDLKAEARKGIRPSFGQGKKLHEIYAKALGSFAEMAIS